MAEYQHTGQPDWGWWSRLWPTPGWTLRTLGLEAGDSVAKVGCGSSYFALPAARIADSEFVYALDLEENLLAILNRLAEQQRIDNLITIHDEARNLPAVLPETVDTLLVANTFHGVEDQAGFVREPSRRSNPAAACSSSTGTTSRLRRRPSRASLAAPRRSSE